MLRLDKNDPLDRMILQELGGKPVPFDTWLDAMDELDEEPDCSQILQERGLHMEDVLQEAETYRKDFYAHLSKWELPPDNRYDLCFALLYQAKKTPCLELTRIFCEILSDPGFLLDHLPQPVDEQDKQDLHEQIVLQYLDFCPARDDLMRTMTLRQELAEKFSALTKQNRNPKPVDCDTSRSYEIVKCFAESLEFPKERNNDILLDNLSNYIQVAASSPELKAIEPLLLFRLLTRHKSRMCSVQALSVNLPSLWKRDKNKIKHNNGRNFKQSIQYLNLFRKLCQIYREDESIDFPLCWYALDQVTVLGEFYREHLSAGWVYADSENDFPFVLTVEELVDDALFSCFENGLGDNALLADSDITPRELDKFQGSDYPPIAKSLEKISDYMNCHIPELAFQAAQADSAGIKALCRDILEQSKISYQPKTPRETALFLAAINSGLMDCQDWTANFMLAQAGHALLGEPTQISISLE